MTSAVCRKSLSAQHPCRQTSCRKQWLSLAIFFGQTTVSLRLRSLSSACHRRIWSRLTRPNANGVSPRLVDQLGVEVRLVNDCGADVTVNEEGELCIRGEIVMPGYWQDPEATREVLDAEGWLHTGDVARQDEDGFVYIVGRKKDMIISGGFNIYPVEVERVIEGHPGVQEVAVIGVPDAIWGEAVKAVVVPRPGVTIATEDIIALCTRHMASYKKPRSVDIVVEELPKNFQGKILKRELRDRYWQGHARRV
jgi:long-chain acyl-CoA synthetase